MIGYGEVSPSRSVGGDEVDDLSDSLPAYGDSQWYTDAFLGFEAKVRYSLEQSDGGERPGDGGGEDRFEVT